MISFVRLIVVVLFSILLCGCKATEKVVSKSDTTTVITQKIVPVAIPEVKLSALAKVSYDSIKGFQISQPKVVGNPSSKPKVNAYIDREGNLLVDVTIPEDSVDVDVSEKETTITNSNTEVIVQKNTLWQNIKIGFLAIGIAVVFSLLTYIVFKFGKK